MGVVNAAVAAQERRQRAVKTIVIYDSVGGPKGERRIKACLRSQGCWLVGSARSKCVLDTRARAKSRYDLRMARRQDGMAWRMRVRPGAIVIVLVMLRPGAKPSRATLPTW